MAKVTARYAELSADEAERMLAEAHDRAEHDQIARERHARREGEARGEASTMRKVVLQMLQSGFSMNEVVKATSLSIMEIERMTME